MMLQVTFVFTNQIDGKLVPLESKVSPKTQGVEANESRGNFKRDMDCKLDLSSQVRKPLEPVSSNGNAMDMAFSTSKLLKVNTSIRSIRTSTKGAIQTTIKPRLSLGNNLPIKRLSSDIIGVDDDFQ